MVNWNVIMRDVKMKVDEYVDIWKLGENPKLKLSEWHKDLYAFNAKAMIDALEKRDKKDLLNKINETIEDHLDILKKMPNSQNSFIILMKSCYIYFLLLANLPN